MKNRKLLIVLAVMVGGIAVLAGPWWTKVEPASTQALPEHLALGRGSVLGADRANATVPSNAMARIDETHEKVIHYTVQVPVYETHTKDIHYTVSRPVSEVREKDIHYTVMKIVSEENAVADSGNKRDRVVKTVKYVPETKVKKVRYTVTTMVQEQRTKSVSYKSCRMVSEKREKTIQYTTTRFVPAAVLQNELEQAKENALDPMGSSRCLN